MSTEQDINVKLIRWLEGDLSGAELSAFESSAEFKEYKKIIETSEDISYPKMDQDAVFSSIQNKISSNKSQVSTAKVIPLKKWFLAIASIAILAFAVSSLFFNSVNISSDVGQLVSHVLPDGSKINLNGNSKINYKSNFEDDRTLQLDGEAFFDVKKGESFIVETEEGKVSVLGTSFNVFSRNDIFTVSCKSGKVKVESNDQSVILQKGERFSIESKVSVGKEIIEGDRIGSWIIGESYFSNSKLEQVALSLSSTYDIQIDLPSNFKDERFTGSFVHDDIKKALKMVFSPMGISYSINEDGKVLISSE